MKLPFRNANADDEELLVAAAACVAVAAAWQLNPEGPLVPENPGWVQLERSTNGSGKGNRFRSYYWSRLPFCGFQANRIELLSR